MKVYAPVLELGPAGAPYGPQVNLPGLVTTDQLTVHGISDPLDPTAFAELGVTPFQETLGAERTPPERIAEGHASVDAAIVMLQAHGANQFVQALRQAGMLGMLAVE